MNPLDIAPRYAGLITGLSNGIGTISGFVAPLVTGWLTNGKVVVDLTQILSC